MTSLKLPDQLKSRVHAAAASTGKSAHAFMLDAIEEQTRAAELRADFVAEALAADAEMASSGIGYPADAVHRYIDALAQGKKAKRPPAKSWRK